MTTPTAEELGIRPGEKPEGPRVEPKDFDPHVTYQVCAVFANTYTGSKTPQYRGHVNTAYNKESAGHHFQNGRAVLWGLDATSPESEKETRLRDLRWFHNGGYHIQRYEPSPEQRRQARPGRLRSA